MPQSFEGEQENSTNHESRNFHVIQVITEYMRQRLLAKNYEWNPPGQIALTEDDHRLIHSLNTLSDQLAAEYGHVMTEMIGRATTRSIVDYTAFTSVADTVMAEGIQWSHVVTLLVFCSELAYTLGVQEGHPDVVINISEWLSRYLTTTASLNSWVASQGGWSALITYERSGPRAAIVTPAGYKASFAVLASNQILYWSGSLVSLVFAALSIFFYMS